MADIGLHREGDWNDDQRTCGCVAGRWH